MIASINKTKEILEKYDLRAKKIFGQNFLIDGNIIKKIVSSAGVNKSTGVIEIGPGLGALTEELCINAKKVLCYDIDEDMINVLNNELKFNNLVIKNEDFLKCDYISALEYFADCDRVIVVSNLPYYITTPIIFRLLERDTIIKEMYFMVQKEVAQRLTGKPNTKDYNSLSVAISYRCKVELLFNVGRNCFMPAPDVESAIISLKRIKNDYGLNNEAKFFEFIKELFCMRRKTIVNNLGGKFNLSKEKIKETLIVLNYKETARAEELSLDQIVSLFKTLNI